jgi:hypothetical protein
MISSYGKVHSDLLDNKKKPTLVVLGVVDLHDLTADVGLQSLRGGNSLVRREHISILFAQKEVRSTADRAAI